MNDAAMFDEVKARYLEGQDSAQIAAELQLTERLIKKYLVRVKFATTVEDYDLPPGTQEKTTLAVLNKLLLNCSESDDARHNKIALGAALLIHKHPLVMSERKTAQPDANTIRSIGGGEISLDGLLETGQEGDNGEN